MNDLIILGASGHGKVVADIAEKNGYTHITFLDDYAEIGSFDKYEIIGKCCDATKYPYADFIVAIGNAEVRETLQSALISANLRVITLIHPSAVVAPTASIDIGTVVMAGAVINPAVNIGTGCIINTSSSIDHDCQIGNFVHISVGSHLAGTVEVGSNTWIGIGATVSNNLTITNNCMIGAGAVVIKSINEPGTYVGVPAKRIR